MVSGSSDQTVRVWDAGHGAPVGDPFTGHTGPVYAVAVGQLDGRPWWSPAAATRRCGCGIWLGDKPHDTTCAPSGYATQHLLRLQLSRSVRLA